MEKLTDTFCKINLNKSSHGNNSEDNTSIVKVNGIEPTANLNQDNNHYSHINGQTHNKFRRKVRDPTWLQVEVCREFLRCECKRSQEECRFAHPKSHCVIDNGKVITCFDSLKSRCMRERCKYFHPPKHIKQQIQYLGKSFQRYNYRTNKNETNDNSDYQIMTPYTYWLPWSMYLSNSVYPYTNVIPNYGFYGYMEFPQLGTYYTNEYSNDDIEPPETPKHTPNNESESNKVGIEE